MNKVLMAVIAAMWAILFTAGTWWVGRAEKKFDLVDQLAFKDHYLNGSISAAPVKTPEPTPAVEKK